MAPKLKAGANNVEEKKSSSKINTNVVLTDYEKNVVFPKLSSLDDEGNVTRELRVQDIYGMNIFEKDNDDGSVTKNKFLSVSGRFINGAGTKCNVTIVVVDDRWFYMTLGNQEVKAITGKDQFVKDLNNMLFILDNITGGISMTEEEIEKEVEDINNYGVLPTK